MLLQNHSLETLVLNVRVDDCTLHTHAHGILIVCLEQLNYVGRDMQHVAYGLRFNDTLKTLKFKGNAIRTDGAEYLGEALACNHTLTALSLAVRTRIKLHHATAKALLHSLIH